MCVVTNDFPFPNHSELHMSIKHKESVESYVACHADIIAALENLIEFVNDLPAPDANGILRNLHYGHLGTLKQMRVHLADAMRMADAFCKDKWPIRGAHPRRRSVVRSA